MAKPWAEVAKSDGYGALSSAEREEAHNEYGREVVALRVPVAELMGVRQAFDADTAPGLVALIKRQLSPPSLPAAANDAVALPEPAPEAYVQGPVSRAMRRVRWTRTGGGINWAVLGRWSWCRGQAEQGADRVDLVLRLPTLG